MEIKENLFGDWHPEVARILNRLGSVYLEQNQFNDAEACFEQALFIRVEKLGMNNSRVLQTLKHMISCYEMQEKLPEALDCAQRAVEVASVLYGEHETSEIVIRIGIIQWLLGQKAEATKSFEKAKTSRIIKFGASSAQVKEVDDTINDLIRASGKYYTLQYEFN